MFETLKEDIKIRMAKSIQGRKSIMINNLNFGVLNDKLFQPKSKDDSTPIQKKKRSVSFVDSDFQF